MDFNQVKKWTIPEGECNIIMDSSENVIWRKTMKVWIADFLSGPCESDTNHTWSYSVQDYSIDGGTTWKDFTNADSNLSGSSYINCYAEVPYGKTLTLRILDNTVDETGNFPEVKFEKNKTFIGAYLTATDKYSLYDDIYSTWESGSYNCSDYISQETVVQGVAYSSYYHSDLYHRLTVFPQKDSILFLGWHTFNGDDPSWDLETAYNINFSGKTINFNITDEDYVGWSISSDVDWIYFRNNVYIYGNSSIDGVGTESYDESSNTVEIDNNTTSATRVGHIFLKRDEKTVSTCTVTQTGITSNLTWDAEVSKTIKSIGTGIIGEQWDIDIENPDSEYWKVESNKSWLGIYSSDSGKGLQTYDGSNEQTDAITITIEQNTGAQRIGELRLSAKINDTYNVVRTCKVIQAGGKVFPIWDAVNKTYNLTETSSMVINITDTDNQGWTISKSGANNVYFGSPSNVQETISGTGNKQVTVVLEPNSDTTNKTTMLYLSTTVDSEKYSCGAAQIIITPYSSIVVDDVLYLGPGEKYKTFTIESLRNSLTVTNNNPDKFICTISNKTLKILPISLKNNTDSNDWNLGSVVVSDGVTSKTVTIIKKALSYYITFTLNKTDTKTYELSSAKKYVSVSLPAATNITLEYHANASATVTLDPKHGVQGLNDGESATIQNDATLHFNTTDDYTEYIESESSSIISKINVNVLGITNIFEIILDLSNMNNK